MLLLQACGTEGSPCCIAPNNNGFVEGTCKNGLTCIPGTTAFGSKAMFDKFQGGYQGAMRDASVTGTCRKATTCNTAYNPCGKAAGMYMLRSFMECSWFRPEPYNSNSICSLRSMAV